MKSGVIGLVLSGFATVAQADGPVKGQACLSPQDMREAIGANQVVAPLSAIQSAREAVPKGEVVRAALCHQKEALVYVVVTLLKDGRFVHVTIDAASGKVNGIH